MANSKNPRKTGWFSAEQTTEKIISWRHLPWGRLRRRSVCTQMANQWNALRKVEGSVAAPNQETSQVAEATPIYRGKFHRLKEVGEAQTNNSCLRFVYGDEFGLLPGGVPYTIAPSVRCKVYLPRIITRLGATCPPLLSGLANYYQQLFGKKALYLQSIQPVYLAVTSNLFMADACYSICSRGQL